MANKVKMANKVVGKDVDISEVIDTMEASTHPPTLIGLMDKWSSVAMSLGTDRELIRSLQQRKLLIYDFKTRDLARELLEEWHNRLEDKATIEELNKVWEKHGLRIYSQALVKKYITPPSPQPNETPGANATEQSALTPEEEFEKQRAHIKRNLDKLVEMTILHASIIAKLEAEDFLGTGDVSLLDSLNNVEEKNMKFYKILQNKQESYEVLIQAMETATQTGVVNLLKRWNS